MWAPLPPEIVNHLNGSMQPDGTLTWEEAQREIHDFRALTDDYDGQGAKAPPPETIAAAAELSRELARVGVVRPSYIVPGPNGTVNVAWELPGGVSVSIEVTEPDEAEVFLLATGREPQHWLLHQPAAV